MRRNAVNDFLFHAGLPHKTKTSLGQVSHSPVKQTARSPTGAKGEVMLLHQSHAQSAHRGVPPNARPDNAAADDEQVEVRLLERLESDCPMEFIVHGQDWGKAPSTRLQAPEKLQILSSKLPEIFWSL